MIATLNKRLRSMPDLIWMMVILWLGFIARVVDLGNQSLWLDEALNWLIARMPLGEGLQAALQVFTHPPLFYVFLHTVALAGQREFVLRFPSAVFGVMGIPLIYHLGRELPGDPSRARQVGLLSAALLAVNPFQVWFSREARNYELVFLLSLLILYAFHRLLQGRKLWVAFVVVSALAYLTHFFSLLIALAQFVYFLLNFRRRYRLFRRWVVAQAVAFLPLSVWLVALYIGGTKSMGIGWIPRPTMLTLFLTFWDFALLYAEHWLPWGVVILPLFAIALILGLQARQRQDLLAVWLLVPSLSMLLVSWMTGRYLYVDRYFITSLPAFVLLVARGIVAFPKSVPYRKWLVGGTAILLLLASTLSVVQILRDPALSKDDWRSVGSLLQESYQAGDRVVLRILEDALPFHYYSPDVAWAYVTNRPEPNPWDDIEADVRRLWLVWSNPNTSNHLPVAKEPFDIYAEADPVTVAWLAGHREEIVAEWSFSGLTVLLVQLTR